MVVVAIGKRWSLSLPNGRLMCEPARARALNGLSILVARDRIELSTRGFSVRKDRELR